MFVGGITYKDLFQGMIEKIPDFTEDSAVRKISSSEISSIVFWYCTICTFSPQKSKNACFFTSKKNSHCWTKNRKFTWKWGKYYYRSCSSYNKNFLWWQQYGRTFSPRNWANPIVCTIKLPPVEILDILAEGYGIERNKSITWGRINMIQRICRKIKQENPELILAVIPEFNRMMYLNQNGRIDSEVRDCDIICDTLCMFVRNTKEGRKFVKELSKNITNWRLLDILRKFTLTHEISLGIVTKTSPLSYL